VETLRYIVLLIPSVNQLQIPFDRPCIHKRQFSRFESCLLRLEVAQGRVQVNVDPESPVIRLNKLIKRVVTAGKYGNTGGGKDAIDGNVPLIALMCSRGWMPPQNCFVQSALPEPLSNGFRGMNRNVLVGINPQHHFAAFIPPVLNLFA
jgi:hypothetical protein